MTAYFCRDKRCEELSVITLQNWLSESMPGWRGTYTAADENSFVPAACTAFPAFFSIDNDDASAGPVAVFCGNSQRAATARLLVAKWRTGSFGERRGRHASSLSVRAAGKIHDRGRPGNSGRRVYACRDRA